MTMWHSEFNKDNLNYNVLELLLDDSAARYF